MTLGLLTGWFEGVLLGLPTGSTDSSNVGYIDGFKLGFLLGLIEGMTLGLPIGMPTLGVVVGAKLVPFMTNKLFAKTPPQFSDKSVRHGIVQLFDGPYSVAC